MTTQGAQQSLRSLSSHSLRPRTSLTTMETRDDNNNSNNTKIKPWGRADKQFLRSLIFDTDVDIRSTDNAYIEQIRSEYFPSRTAKNFRRNFKAFAAEWETESEVSGGRQREAYGGKRQMYLFTIFSTSTKWFVSCCRVSLLSRKRIGHRRGEWRGGRRRRRRAQPARQRERRHQQQHHVVESESTTCKECEETCWSEDHWRNHHQPLTKGPGSPHP